METATANKLTQRPMLNSPRQYRAIEALLKGDVSREQLDRIAGASNSPALIAGLRDKGLTIPCERVASIDRDGNKTRHGVYSFTVDDKILAKAWLAI